MLFLFTLRFFVVPLRFIIRKIISRRKLLTTSLLILSSIYGLSSFIIFHSFNELSSDDINAAKETVVISSLHDPWVEEQKKINVNYYYLANNSDYHFEFRYEFNTNTQNNDHRLMIFTCGRGRTCIDYWRFPVGRRIVYAMRKAGFSILAICSKRRLYETEVFIPFNEDVKWIYKSLQRWINRIYFQRFQRYPLLYIHGVSRGAAFAPSLARVLPIQALILTVYPSNKNASTTRSLYSSEMQQRLAFDSTFANWFYFDYCYNKISTMKKNWSLCPFETNLSYFSPVPPTFFVTLDSDPAVPLVRYRKLIKLIQQDSLHLGGKLLNHRDAIMMEILSPANVTETYMQENYDLWYNKPYASRLFFEHFTNKMVHVGNSSKAGTCRCSKVNFTYWEGFPNITATWSLQKQAELKDFISDIKRFQNMFCEELCGDITAYHGIVSRKIEKVLDWTAKIDILRQKMHIDDYLSRSVRVWAYRKQSILNGIKNFSSYIPNWASVEKQYQRYAAEYFVQDYFTQMNLFKPLLKNILIWTEDPLLADYFIVPHDLMYLYFRNKPETLDRVLEQKLRTTLNQVYFDKVIKNLQNRFPYWTMAESLQTMGSNHIFTFVGPKNMDFLDGKYQSILKNVIQLVHTGIRSDFASSVASTLHPLRNTTITYRHDYDIVLPHYTNLEISSTLVSNIEVQSKHKKYLFYYSAMLNLTMTNFSSLRQLKFWLKNQTTIIQNKTYQTFMIPERSSTQTDYMKSMLSSIFAISSESFVSCSPQIYEAVQLRVIPIILGDNMVLPFERFIDWSSFSVKININSIKDLPSRFSSMIDFPNYMDQKLKHVTSNLHTFRWPYTVVFSEDRLKNLFKLENQFSSNQSNIFYYISLELRCRRLEQLYGLEADVTSTKSIRAQAKACANHPKICPCRHRHFPLAFHEYT